MRRRDVTNNVEKENPIKKFILFILVLAIFVISIMWLLKINGSTKTKQIITDLITAQAIISEYIGKMKSETFDIYTTEEILIGSTDINNIEETRIKDNDSQSTPQIVTIENKIEKDNVTFYKLNIDVLDKEFGLKLFKDDEIIWYVQETGIIKVNYINKPNWWTRELDAIYIGN